MMDLTPETFRKEVGPLSRRLQSLTERLRRRGKLSDAQETALSRIQAEKERLAARLSDADLMRTNWDLIKIDFAQDWNAFVGDLEELEVSLKDKVASGSF